jgi:hypothetical protein
VEKLMAATTHHVPKLRTKELRQEVTRALLHLQDVTWLVDSPLVDFPAVHKAAVGKSSLFAEGEALREVLTETVQGLTARLSGEGRVGLLRATLEGILEYQSIAQIARKQGLTREHFSRTYWKQAANLVADRFLALNGASGSRYT